MKQKKVMNAKTIALIGMFGALAAVLESVQFPVPFAPPFYNLDFAEVPVLIGAFALGPVPAVMIELIKNLLKLLIRGTSTMYVGELANFIGGVIFVVPAALIYQRKKTKKTAMTALSAGVLLSIVGAVVINCAVTLPFYAKVAFGGIDNIIAMGTKVNPAITNLYTFAIFAIVPFNLLKSGLNAVATALVYKHVSVMIHAAAPTKTGKPAAEKM